MYTLTIIYEDDTTFLVGTFNSQIELDNWLNVEKQKNYWKAINKTQEDYTPIVELRRN